MNFIYLLLQCPNSGCSFWYHRLQHFNHSSVVLVWDLWLWFKLIQTLVIILLFPFQMRKSILFIVSYLLMQCFPMFCWQSFTVYHNPHSTLTSSLSLNRRYTKFSSANLFTLSSRTRLLVAVVNALMSSHVTFSNIPTGSKLMKVLITSYFLLHSGLSQPLNPLRN